MESRVLENNWNSQLPTKLHECGTMVQFHARYSLNLPRNRLIGIVISTLDAMFSKYGRLNRQPEVRTQFT